MDSKRISSFAKLLRENGDKILNSGFKLILSGSLLRALNESFIFIVDQNEIIPPKNFQVVKTNNSKSEEIRDLQFIHDFIQKTLVLSLTSYDNDEIFEGNADISKFRNLQKLEIQRFNVKQITGIQQLRPQLQEIICARRSLDTIKDIISDCGGDHSNGFVWNELKYANFSCNNLTTIDCSLEFAPWLQNLNLSHNQIVSVDAIKWLAHLKVLDLSFNKLTRIPHFNFEAGKRLQCLILSNNFIEELFGLSRLNALKELNLSGNCLLDHNTLGVISQLPSLCCLNLKENPLSFNQKHRDKTSKFLHKNTSTIKFILDNEPLTKHEKSLIGTEIYHPSIHSSRSSLIASSEWAVNRPIQRTTPLGSVSSIEENLNIENPSGSNINQSQQNSRKKIRPRTIAIGDECIVKRKAKVVERKIDNNNDEHLETKKEIETRRKLYGDRWLNLVDGNELPDRTSSEIMLKNYLESTNSGDEHSNSLPRNNAEHITFSATPPTNNNRTSTPINNFITPIDKEIVSPTKTEYKSDIESDKNETFYKSIDISDENVSHIETINNITPLSILDDIYKKTESDEPQISDSEENEFTYNITMDLTGEELFLVTSEKSIREKDKNSGRTKVKWSLKMLESCERIKSDTIRINFETIQKNRKERIYKMETIKLCQKLQDFIREICSSRPLSEMNQKLFRCANCSAQFSRELNADQNIAVQCPECRKSYVIEVKESPKNSNWEKLKTEITQKSGGVGGGDDGKSLGLRKSASHSSLAPQMDAWRLPLNLALSSVGSLNESSSCSKISNSESSFDSNQSVAGSSNSERDRDKDLNCKNGMESDIEILSNPSQSSIEILDRKPSEERRLSIHVPLLESIEDDGHINLSTTLTDQCTSTQDDQNNIVKMNNNKKEKKDVNLLGIGVHLTESSSSGSITDSICTAYEQNDGTSPAHDATLTITGNDSTPTNQQDISMKSSDTSVLSSMLNNLLQSTNLLLSKSTKTPERNDLAPIDPFKYSYTDYTEADHRIKLYFYQNLFEDENENFKWLARGKIVDENQIDEMPHGFDGLIVISTTKCYILKYSDNEYDDDPNKWLKKYLSVTIDRLEESTILPWKIGISFKIKIIGTLHLLLYDIIRTDSLLLHLTTNLPDTCTINYQSKIDLQQKIIKKFDNRKIEMFGLLKSCIIQTETKNFFINSIIIVTELFINLIINYKWLCTNNNNNNSKLNNNYDIEMYDNSQEMSNLIEYKKLTDKSFILYFLDDKYDKCENWEINFETIECCESTLNAICQAWEKIFDVPLTSN